MNNKYLERELKTNISNHELFECQTGDDLDNIKTFLEKRNLITEIIVNFDTEKIENSLLLNIFPYESEENRLIWNQFVAIQIMKELKKELNLEVDKDLEEQETIIYKGSKEDYFNYEKNIPTSENIKMLINIVNTPIRIHLILKWYTNKYLHNAISEYLEHDLKFNTMVYSDRYLEKIENSKISYIKFNKLEEGININKEKQKVKIYEEV